MKIPSPNPRLSARGLTLIELVVVLAILVALAGLIIGNFPSLLRKASGSTSANTLQDIARAMSIQYTTRGSYASGFDSLIETDGTTLARLPDAAKAGITATAVSGDLAALQALGIKQVCNLIPYPATAPDATWSVSTNANLVSLVAGTRLALANSALFGRLIPTTNSLGLNPQVWILGVGKVCTLIGPDSTLLEAPTRTGSSEADNSANYYQRYCVSFLVDGPAGSRRARFLGAVAPAASGFELTEDAQKMYSAN